MRTAVAADEPDEPDEPDQVRVTYSRLTMGPGTVGTNITFMRPGPLSVADLAKSQPQPWCCPSCKTWMAPTVAEHRCP